MSTQDWIDKARKLGPELAEVTARHDEDGTFVEESFAALKDEGFFKALVPTELGGGGAGFRDICEFIREISQHCASTGLAFSMHSHLIAATVWKYKLGKPGEAMLRKVVDKDLILVSTGAGDWLDSNGVLAKVDGGFRYTSKKPFASGSPVANMMVTSGRYDDPDTGSMVLHFPLAFSAEGVTRGDDWDTHGMRGTGSNTVSIDGAFIPDESVALSRPRGPWHPAFNVISTLALPIIMSTYVGVAERAVTLALASAKKRSGSVENQFLAGELSNQLFTVHALWNAHIANANEYDFAPELARATAAVQGKTTLAEACIRTVETAMELGGGSAFFRKSGIEKLMRDVRAAPYHPLQPKRQHLFSGRVALGLEPIAS
ncbi:MAG: alkylation response protein AidB-like acyl-CoA dehydrogenase [Myxococcota bacterium]|jgi:alkylation response protein AidB-like acyl-CoA dehydrogenase